MFNFIESFEPGVDLLTLNFFYDHFADQQMNFLYTGNFNDEHTNCFIELNNHQYNSADEYKMLQRKAGFLIAECFQNIVRHNETSNNDSYFHIRNSNGLLRIVSANRVQNEIIPSLKSQLEGLNKLTSEELKEEYRRILTDEGHTEKGGAGLGMIEMARKTKNKLNFTFTDIDQENSYFYFKLHLSLSDLGHALENNFDESILLRSKMLQDQLFFIYKGVISIQTTIVMLEIIENSLDSINQKVIFVKYMGLFERLSNQLSSPLAENSSMVFIGEDDQHYSIAVSCILPISEAIQLERSVKFYTSMDESALDAEYKSILASKDQKIHYKNNMEIIELIKNCASFEIHSQAYGENISLLTMDLKFNKKQKPQFLDQVQSVKSKPRKDNSIQLALRS